VCIVCTNDEGILGGTNVPYLIAMCTYCESSPVGVNHVKLLCSNVSVFMMCWFILFIVG
jgi:hypothetical protein